MIFSRNLGERSADVMGDAADLHVLGATTLEPPVQALRLVPQAARLAASSWLAIRGTATPIGSRMMVVAAGS